MQASLDKLVSDKSSQRTTIIVAHRLSTIQNCDRIFVLNNDLTDDLGAKVVESGTHDELMELGGRYMLLRQAFDGDSMSQ